MQLNAISSTYKNEENELWEVKCALSNISGHATWPLHTLCNSHLLESNLFLLPRIILKIPTVLQVMCVPVYTSESWMGGVSYCGGEKTYYIEGGGGGGEMYNGEGVFYLDPHKLMIKSLAVRIFVRLCGSQVGMENRWWYWNIRSLGTQKPSALMMNIPTTSAKTGRRNRFLISLNGATCCILPLISLLFQLCYHNLT